MPLATVCFCTYNRAHLLQRLVGEIRAQFSTAPFEILAVDNTSSDGTQDVLERLRKQPGPPLRVVMESRRGIVHARNRAIEEALRSEFLIFLDDDELPESGFVAAAVDALSREKADCVGGKILVHFDPGQRPPWMADDLLRYLGELDNGDHPLWIKSSSTPVWGGNSAFSVDLFRKGLRFDQTYNRVGKRAGGGEDTALFEALLKQGAKIRYRPDMVIRHLVESWRLRRRYFLHLAYLHGWNQTLLEKDWPRNGVFGVPRFVMRQALERSSRGLFLYLRGRRDALREAMGAAHSIGMLAAGFHSRWFGQ